MIEDLEDSTPAAVGDSPGHHLAKVRQRRGVTVEHIARELRLKTENVVAVEEDAYDRLPSAVFVSGYIRSYARLLDIDPEPLIERFQRLHPNAEPPPPRVSSPPIRRVGGAHLVARVLVLSLALAAIATLGYWAWQTDWSRMDRQQTSLAGDPDALDLLPETGAAADADPAAAQAETPAPTSPPLEARATSERSVSPATAGDTSTAMDNDDTTVLPPTIAASTTPNEAPDESAPGQSTADVEPMAMTARPDAAPTGATADDDGNPTTTEPAPASTTEESAQPPTETDDQIVVAFSGPCWVDVRDASGEVELFGEMADGDRRVLSGSPPFSLILGNAAAAEVRVGARVIDLAAIAKGNVARFDLDPESLPATVDADSGSNPAPSGNPAD